MKLIQAPPFDRFPITMPTSRPVFSAGVKALADAIRAADGVIFISPEYN
jgi:NAD(P)H-dependent FMN reductase